MAQAQQTNLMPVPTSVSLNKENYRLTDNFTIKITGLADKRLYKEASRFMQLLSEKTGLFFKTWEIPNVSHNPSAALKIHSIKKGGRAIGYGRILHAKRGQFRNKN